MKIYLLLFFLIFSIFKSQTRTVKILDLETGSPLKDVRLISAAQIFYTNADGKAVLPEAAKDFIISLPGYKILSQKSLLESVKLEPVYKDIEEVEIVSIDVKKIINEVSKNFEEVYYNQPAIYDITYSKKSFENSKLTLLMIADGQYWIVDGQYNAKKAFNKKYDEFVQLQIDTLRYFKTEPNTFDIKVQEPKVNHQIVGNLFFDFELFYLNRRMKQKNVITTGTLLSENGQEQIISYKVKLEDNRTYFGKIIFNKIDRAISYYEINFDQSNSKPESLKDINGAGYTFQFPDGTYIYDFYKTDGKYVISKISQRYDHAKYVQDGKSYEYKSAKDIIFRTFKPVKDEKLKNPVEINYAFWRNMKINDDKGLVNLSEEEKKFVNE